MLRLVEMIIPKSSFANLKEVLEDQNPINLWVQPLTELWVYPENEDGKISQIEDSLLVRIFLREEGVEMLLDTLEERFSGFNGFRINFITLAASIPVPLAPEITEVRPADNSDKSNGERVSRHELYGIIEDNARFSRTYLILIIFSSVVAAIGLLGNNTVVIIGAMVISPMLAPFMALSLATTLADRSLAWNALKSIAAGLVAAVGLSMALGYIFLVSPGNSEIASRMEVNLVDIALALASGGAGALALTAGASGTLVGVAISASLIPPLVIFGLLLGSGEIGLAIGSLMLFVVNVICINLAGTAVFLAQGITPATWWDAKKAWKSTRLALILWSILLIGLAAAIWLSRGR